MTERERDSVLFYLFLRPRFTLSENDGMVPDQTFRFTMHRLQRDSSTLI